MMVAESLQACLTFDTEEAFYADRPLRKLSRECDYGVQWQLGGQRFPQWRLSYIQATGEVYAICHWHDARPRVIVLGEFFCNTQLEGPAYYRELDELARRLVGASKSRMGALRAGGKEDRMIESDVYATCGTG